MANNALKPERLAVSSADIRLGLRSSFPAPGWNVFYEVGNDTGSKARRHADAVAIGIWPSTGHMVHGFEIKVSRADWANEMKDPTKSWAVMQFCNRWSLVTPPGLVKADELPDNWGLMTFDGATMRTVKPAPKLTPEPLTPGFVAAMVRRAGDADAAIIEAAERRGAAAGVAEHKRRIGDALTKHEADALRREVAQAREAMGKLKEVFPDITSWNIDSYLPAIKAAQKAGLGGHYGAITGMLNTMEVAARRIRESYAAAGFELPAGPVELDI